MRSPVCAFSCPFHTSDPRSIDSIISFLSSGALVFKCQEERFTRDTRHRTPQARASQSHTPWCDVSKPRERHCKSGSLWRTIRDPACCALGDTQSTNDDGSWRRELPETVVCVCVRYLHHRPAGFLLFRLLGSRE